MNVMFGASTQFFKKIPLDLNKKEIIIYWGLMILMFWLGITWQSFLF
jgi:hypothetical protein